MIAAIAPAKALSKAKARLAAVLSERERERLALAMLQDVLHCLKGVKRLEVIAVVSPDREVLALAEGMAVKAIKEPAGIGEINGALTHALEEIGPWRSLSDAVLIVLGDVPLISPPDIERVLDALPYARGAVLCPSNDQGTSALALRPPDCLPFRFGPQSSLYHNREAVARGIPMQALDIDSLAHDIDEPDALFDLLTRPGRTATHHLLADIGAGHRLEARRHA